MTILSQYISMISSNIKEIVYPLTINEQSSPKVRNKISITINNNHNPGTRSLTEL